MKNLSSLALAGILLASSVQAHAVSQPDAIVNGVNDAGSGPVAHPQLGGGPGDPIGGICTGSPENATVVLALVSVAGLMAGRRFNRLRLARTATAQAL